MSGLATAAIITGVLAAGASTYQGITANKSAKKARSQQDAAQTANLSATLRDEKIASQARRRANKRKPDVASLLASATGAQGPASNIFAGGGAGGKPLLGGRSTLGG